MSEKMIINGSARLRYNFYKYKKSGSRFVRGRSMPVGF